MHNSAPANEKTVGGKAFDDALFPPDAIALRAQPLGPVIGHGGGRGEKSNGKEEEEP